MLTNMDTYVSLLDFEDARTFPAAGLVVFREPVKLVISANERRHRGIASGREFSAEIALYHRDSLSPIPYNPLALLLCHSLSFRQF
jgi:hypothetical protein